MSVKASTVLSTVFGEFVVNYHQKEDKRCLSITKGDLSIGIPLVRIHSACMFGEALGSTECDCGDQLEKTLEEISKRNQGVLIYLWQEGRGQGILNKIKAMDVQRNHNYDTVEAFSHLSLDLDPRNYTIVEEVFKDLEVSTKIALITNNPNKLEYVKKIGYTVDQLIHLKYHRNDFVKKDLLVKKKKLGHIIPDL